MRNLSLFIPGFLKKLDEKLLYRSPQLWITKIHYALFYSLLLSLLLYGGCRLLGADLTHRLANPWNSFALMIIPGLAIFFWWFVLQAQYNVDKNYGKLNLRHDYQNFFSYLIIIASFFVVMLSVPFAQVHNLKAAVPMEQLAKDVHDVNKGVAYFRGNFSQLDDSNYQVSPDNYVYLGYYELYSVYDESEKDFLEFYEQYENRNNNRIVSRAQALTEIINFKEAYNKYTNDPIDASPEEILAQKKYYELDEYYYYRQQSVSSKLGTLIDHHVGGYREFINADILKFFGAIVGLLALLAWIFKNVHWKNYLAAGVTSLLSPLLMGITAVILYDILRIRNSNEEIIIFTILILLHLALIIMAVSPIIKRKYSWLGVISTILVQFWTPIFIMIYGLLIWELMRHSGYYSWEETKWIVDVLYISGWIFLVGSLWLFKKYYAFMWAQPKSR